MKKNTYDDPKHPVSRFRAGVIFSLAGARGAVTLASVMSIPLLLSEGTAFPERDHIQAMLEIGRISRETAKEMRHNISLLEVQLKKDYF